MKNFLVVILSVAFSVLLIEGLLIWRPEFQARPPSSKWVICTAPSRPGRPHPLFGWTGAPDIAYFEQTSEADGWTAHINNSDGFRDLFDSGNKHAFVLGDSFTQGVNANNNETFPYLLDLWNPDIAFHDFGVPQYGTQNSLLIYKFFSPNISHELTVLAYFLGNDLHDNMSKHNYDMRPASQQNISFEEQLKEVNSQLRQTFRTYNLLYSFARSFFGGFALSPEEIEKGIKITRILLEELANETKSNRSDLLLVALPSWNQMKDLRGVEEEFAQQMALLEEIANRWDHIYLIDISNIFDRMDLDEVYGIKDKHFSPYGYYLTAKAIHEWIGSEWPRGPQAGTQAPPFQPSLVRIEPECAVMPEYREGVATRSRQNAQTTARR